MTNESGRGPYVQNEQRSGHDLDATPSDWQTKVGLAAIIIILYTLVAAPSAAPSGTIECLSHSLHLVIPSENGTVCKSDGPDEPKKLLLGISYHQ